MSSIEPTNQALILQPRRRLTREARHRQLMDAAWQLIREEGTEALSLGRLAERSDITKPVVYDHFGTRSGLLAALYREFDARQTAIMDAARETSEPTLASKATIIASSYVDCVLAQGREISGIIAALAGSPELERMKRDYEVIFIEKCRAALAPFAGKGTIGLPGLWAMLGAAEALSYAAASGDITAEQAQNELFETIVAMVERSAR
ncbi:TetR/AcrR family transcriptional regulator [Phyllobacterium sp. 628]|uniref:TetR/AcrR family transcriptional regulator n=1 Tax=Phyllobacterium sp. 628 TaxID=2718938 RepID=UPI00166225DE|nr:TetR/AcrR family transcriptional regulator [Phyllobacterium sp. 628]QND52364.1 TetR/AcrR family transcriptional regulator [Phyllobacterium sp. 628]